MRRRGLNQPHPQRSHYRAGYEYQSKCRRFIPCAAHAGARAFCFCAVLRECARDALISNHNAPRQPCTPPPRRKPNHRNNKSAVQLPARPPQLAMDFACTACVQQGSDGEQLSSAIDKKRTSAIWPSQRVSSNRRVIRCGGWEAVERGDFAMKIELGFLLVKQLGMRVIAP